MLSIMMIKIEYRDVYKKCKKQYHYYDNASYAILVQTLLSLLSM